MRNALGLTAVMALAGCVVVPVPGEGHHRGHGREVVVVPSAPPAPRVIVVPQEPERRGHGRRGGRWKDDD